MHNFIFVNKWAIYFIAILKARLFYWLNVRALQKFSEWKRRIIISKHNTG